MTCFSWVELPDCADFYYKKEVRYFGGEKSTKAFSGFGRKGSYEG